MNNNWSVKKLGEVCNFQNGFAFKSSDYVDDGYFVMRITNVQDGCIVLNNPKYITDNYISEDNPFVLHEEDILMSLTGNVGRVGVIKAEHLPAVLNQRVARIVIKSPDLLDKNYLFYYFRCPIFLKTVVSGGKGMAQQNVSTSFISDIIIPLPSLEEQKKIVKVLEEKLGKIKEAIKLREEAIVDTEKILPSRLTEIFEDGKKKGWDVTSFGNKEVLEIIDGDRGKNYPKKHNFSENGFCLFLNTSNVRYGDFNFNKCDFISEEVDSKLRKGRLNRGDVVLTTRGTLGNSAYYSSDISFDNVRINSGMVIIRANQTKLNQRYLINIFKSPKFISLIKESNSGSAQPQLPIKVLTKLELVLPDLQTQQKIVKELDELTLKVSELQKLQESQLSDLKALEQAYLREAFSGDLI